MTRLRQPNAHLDEVLRVPTQAITLTVAARTLVLFAALLTGVSPARAQESPSTPAVEEVRAATLAFYAALNRADAVTADHYLLPGGDSFPRNGQALDPEAPTEQQSLQNLSRLFTAGLHFNVKVRQLQVKAYGDAAIATFYTEGITTGVDHSSSQGTYRATYVWIKRDGGWKIAHFHISPLA